MALQYNWRLDKLPFVKLCGLLIFSVLLISACGGGSGSQNNVVSVEPQITEPDTILKATQSCAADSPYTLTITGGNKISIALLEKMVCTFFETYPKTAALLNPNTSKNIFFVFKPNPGFIAGASGNTITFDTNWLIEHPLDTDIVVHELTHIVQAGLGQIPGWLVEGTADYVRDLYGLQNFENGWSIPIRYTPNQKYTDGYGNAAAFLKWIDAIYRQQKPRVIESIYQSGATTPYSDAIWISLTGKSLDALWDEYKNYPVTPAFETGISLFLGANYKSREIKLERGNYDLGDLLSLGVPDNEIASIKIPTGYKIKVYTDINFAGEMTELTADTPALSENFVRKISSLVVE